MGQFKTLKKRRLSRAQARRSKSRNLQKRLKGGATPTFHVLIASGGRSSIHEMIDSLTGELQQGDALTIVFDREKSKEKSGYTDEWLKDFVPGVTVNIKVETDPSVTGNFGHLILNKYKAILTPETTFGMFADDDDVYISGSFANLRTNCTDPNTVYISKMNYIGNKGHILPNIQNIQPARIGKPNGIIPSAILKDQSLVFGTDYLSDYEYYKSIKESKKAPIAYLNDVIYTVGADQGNAKVGGNKKGGFKKYSKKDM
jgi:hypothetical protein